ncbi:UPF0755 protein [Cognatiyoonia koreensis]|uniref:Endolytic murein transglycosylase n=1 Tax=Cognatiyoonia koreensis TaxID=364200 RepID=A0A1I0NRJ4_9RHOB|nr:endolytic transglycosylase MltG [Cognatiyoonia koreensis]SEW04155.1 UPF0755 protein [Cognatiyoonia koreensis]
MWRHIASNALTVFIVGLFLVAGAIAWGGKQYDDPGPLASAICLKVAPGSNMSRVSDNLVEQGAISSGLIFNVGVDYSGKSGQLKAGSFLVPERASMAEIVDIVTRGGQNTCGTEVVYRVGVNRTTVQVRELDPITGGYDEVAAFDPAEEKAPAEYLAVREASDTQYRVSIAEGVTSWQITDSLNRLDVLDGDIQEVPAEGLLAPNSYSFVPGSPASEIVAKMAADQTRIIEEAWASRDEGLPLSSPEEMLILASIIEKETGVAEERRQVASVFINRLNQGMKLQTDPTVIYGITRGEGILGRGLRQSELRTETPWNTYVIPALPPTPIANPGRASIQAAVNPDDTDFIFFVADGTGGHAFADNLDDHNRNVAAWRQIEAERAESNN